VIQDIRKSFDVLDAELIYALPGYVPGWVNFTREQIGPGYVVFTLSQDDLGDNLGRLTLRKLGPELTQLTTQGPGMVSDRELDRQRHAHFREVLRVAWQRIREDRAARVESKAPKRDERGINAGTAERVKKMHELMGTRKHSQEWCRKRAHIDPRTYKDKCKQVTGEDPIQPGDID
jgi:hypothetical protein